MSDPKRPTEEEEPVEITCPECGDVVSVPLEVAEREMSVRCRRGHEIPLMKAL